MYVLVKWFSLSFTFLNWIYQTTHFITSYKVGTFYLLLFQYIDI